jgi:chemotaxis protein MotC
MLAAALAALLATSGAGAHAQPAGPAPGEPLLLVPPVAASPPAAAPAAPMLLVAPDAPPPSNPVQPAVRRPTAVPQSPPPRPVPPSPAAPTAPAPLQQAASAPPSAAVDGPVRTVPLWRWDGPDLAVGSPSAPAPVEEAVSTAPAAEAAEDGEVAEAVEVSDDAMGPPRDVAAGMPPVRIPPPADLPPPVHFQQVGDIPVTPPSGEADVPEDGPISDDVAAGLPPVFPPAPADLPVTVFVPAPNAAAPDIGDDLPAPPPQDPDASPAPVEPSGTLMQVPDAAATAAAPSEPAPPATEQAPAVRPSVPSDSAATIVGDGIRVLLELLDDPVRSAAGGGAPVVGDRTGDAERSRSVRESIPPTEAPSGNGLVAPPIGDGEAPEESSPVRLVRRLQQLQDQMAAGSPGAVRRQRVLLDSIEDVFGAAKPETWADPANAHALVTFVLSGGNPAALRDVLGRTPPPPIDERLMRGVLAYVEGREDQAATLLADVDVLAVPPSMGAQLALAKAALAVSSDLPLAIGMLDTARLLAPGTLAEEAALRREIFVVSQTDDLEKFELLSTQYLARFRYSVYAGNFRQRFAAALTRMDFIDDPEESHRLDDMLADLDVESRRDIYLLVARAAVNRGLTFASTFAAERALAISDPNSVDAARGRLYRAAVLVVTPSGLSAGLADLRSVDPARLPPDDAALHQAASSTAKLILTAPDLPEPSDTAEAPAPAAAGASIAGEPVSEVESRARQALATVDDLLKKSAR